MSTLPPGYCTLASAVERTAEALFGEEFKRTTISPQESERLARHEQAKADLWLLPQQARWRRVADEERQRAEEAKRADQERLEQMTPDEGRQEEERRRKVREKADAARGASAGNVGSGWSRKRPGHRLLTEEQEQAIRRDAADTDETRSTRERKALRKSQFEQARDHLRRTLWKDRVTGYLLVDGDLVSITKAVWWTDWWTENWSAISSGEQIRLKVGHKRLQGRAMVFIAELDGALSGRSAQPIAQPKPPRAASRAEPAFLAAEPLPVSPASRATPKRGAVQETLQKLFPEGFPTSSGWLIRTSSRWSARRWARAPRIERPFCGPPVGAKTETETYAFTHELTQRVNA